MRQRRAQSAERRASVAAHSLSSLKRSRTLCALRSALCALVVACDVPAPSAPALQPGLVVFSVLDPGSAEQIVLLMQSRGSVPDVSQLTIVPNDPIVSSGETPVSGARVVLYVAGGDSAVAIEDRVARPDRLGAGVYRIASGGPVGFTPPGAFLPLIAGRTYRLRVTSRLGDAEATTHLPTVDRVVTGPSRNLNLARDSVLLSGTSPSAAGYIYSLRGPNGTSPEGDQQFRRDLERRLILPSGEDWAFSFASDRLQTSTRHVLTVTAADSNYFAYYGSQGDPFADRTQRTTLKGAAGVFGAITVVATIPITIAQGR
jgi:hypothetical protein